ncbi:MAG: hypothetical protein ABL921_35190, partial [Pirellula sp.]
CHANPTKLGDIVCRELESLENKGLIRIVLCAAAECKPILDRVAPILVSQKVLWADYNITPELSYFIERSWEGLSSDYKESIVRLVMTLEPFSYRSTSISPERAEEFRKHTVIDWLMLFQELGLPLSVIDDAGRMLEEYSQQTGKTKRFKQQGIQVLRVDPTPDSARQFSEMSAIDILAFCSTFEPVGDFVDQKTPRGVASMLDLEVSNRPSEFLDLSVDILGLPYPVYHSAIADGLTNALRNGLLFDRVRAAALLSEVVRSGQYPLVAPGMDPFDFGDEKWVRSATARFLDQASQNDSDPLLSQEALVSLWNNLWPAADSNSSVSGDIDAMTEVINSEGGHLSMAMCRLYLRILCHDEKSSERAKWVDQLRSVIEINLLASKSQVVRAPLGFFFTSFFLADRSWAEKHSRLIFDLSKFEIWEAAWSCHFWISQRYIDVFRHLQEHYEFALSVADWDEDRNRAWIERMGDDFAIFWMSGDLDGRDELLRLFWRNAPRRAKTSAALWINSRLKRDSWLKMWPRARVWWQMAITGSSADGPDPSHSYFLYWLEASPDELTLSEVEELIIVGVEAKGHYLGEVVWDFLDARVDSEPKSCAKVIRAISTNT